MNNQFILTIDACGSCMVSCTNTDNLGIHVENIKSLSMDISNTENGTLTVMYRGKKHEIKLITLLEMLD